jgi:hypothetical protein
MDAMWWIENFEWKLAWPAGVLVTCSSSAIETSASINQKQTSCQPVRVCFTLFIYHPRDLRSEASNNFTTSVSPAYICHLVTSLWTKLIYYTSWWRGVFANPSVRANATAMFPRAQPLSLAAHELRMSPSVTYDPRSCFTALTLLCPIFFPFWIIMNLVGFTATCTWTTSKLN